MDRLINLPDFVSKKVDMLDAARMFKKAIDENCDTCDNEKVIPARIEGLNG